MKFRMAALCVLVSFVWLAANAQQTIEPQITVRDPRTRVTFEEPLRITAMDIDVRVHGCVSETSITMSFRSYYHDNLEGSFLFPLPYGATVSGYALDIGDRMVDGVVVEKEEATRIFETEVRKSIDPGLVEWSEGEVFRTRVYPIPPYGSRTIMLRYVSQLPLQAGAKGDEYRYVLPLRTDYPIESVNVSISVISSKAPENRSPFSLRFRRNGGIYEASKSRSSFTF